MDAATESMMRRQKLSEELEAKARWIRLISESADGNGNFDRAAVKREWLEAEERRRQYVANNGVVDDAEGADDAAA